MEQIRWISIGKLEICQNSRPSSSQVISPIWLWLGFEQLLRSFTLNEHNEAIQHGPSSLEEESKSSTYLDTYGMFDQLTINDYAPGQGIPPHVDTHSPFQEVLASLSLKSGATMHFKNPEGVTKDIYLKPRSLALFTGESRYNWLHSISQRKIDKVDGLLRFRHRRVSLTFRKIKTTPCSCRFPKLCDSQN